MIRAGTVSASDLLPVAISLRGLLCGRIVAAPRVTDRRPAVQVPKPRLPMFTTAWLARRRFRAYRCAELAHNEVDQQRSGLPWRWLA